MFIERRKSTRYEVDECLYVFVEVGFKEWVGVNCKNISLSGVLIETWLNFEIGEELKLKFVNTKINETIILNGIIVRHEEVENGNTYGISFEALVYEEQHKLSNMISNL